MTLKLQGVIVPIVTPFTATGQLDHIALKRLVDHLIDCGVAGLFPVGLLAKAFS